MTKKVFIIHGWDGYPEEGWFPWLKRELEGRDFKVEVPAMPNPEHPKIEEWVPFLKNLVGKANKEIFFVGHSIGCQTILRYLEALHEKIKVGGVVLVAPWVNLVNLSGPEEKKIAEPWLKTPIQWGKIVRHANNFVAFFSDNDPFVPLSDSKIFAEKLEAKIIVEHERGHFSGSDNVTEVHSVLNELLKIVK